MSSVVFVLNRFRTRTCTWSSLSSTHDFLFADAVAPTSWEELSLLGVWWPKRKAMSEAASLNRRNSQRNLEILTSRRRPILIATKPKEIQETVH